MKFIQSVRYKCDKCGYSEKIKLYDKISIIFINLFSFIGIISTLFLGYVYFNYDISPISLTSEVIVSSELRNYGRDYDIELRDYALKVTKDCEGSNPECFAKYIYINLSRNVKYIPTSKYQIFYDPFYVLENGGDCKNSAILFSSLMRSLGFDSFVKCNLNYQHCISKVPLRNAYELNPEYEEYILVDISNKIYKKGNITKNIWDLFNETI